jgi:V8-like Glu-specific endopeptidase
MPEVATEGLTASATAELQSGIAQWLSAERPQRSADNPILVQLSADQLQRVENPEVVNAAPLQVGVVVPLATPISMDGIKPGTSREGNAATGTLVRTADGGYVWSATIGSVGAGAVRLHVENLFLPDNASLYFYSDSGEAYGPYFGTGPENNGDLWTPSVFGEMGTLQIRVDAPVGKLDLSNISFSVTEVGHVSRAFFGLAGVSDGGVAAVCPINASCVLNNQCVTQPIVDPAEGAVAKMLWISGAYIYTCTGGLLNDTVAATQIPYFLTANHCLSKNNAGLEAFFQYKYDSCNDTSNCTGTWDDPAVGTYAGKTVGATVKATSRTGDFTLLQLNQNPPAGSVFLGWTNVAVSGTNGHPLYRVSHPSGSPQSYSDQTVSTSAPTCQGWPRGQRIYSRGVNGATEGGSSGSPVVNASGQVVGQLSGSCGTNNSNVCNHTANATVDGAFANYWSKVQPFLAP